MTVPAEVVFRQQEYPAAAVFELEPQEGHARISLLQSLLTVTHFDHQDAARREVRIGLAQDSTHHVEPVAAGAQDLGTGQRPVRRRWRPA